MQREKISFIVPVYNAEHYLKQCIESVLSQTYSNWELVLINDGSTDGSELICKSYEVKDKRIKYFHKHNGGVSSARNVGIEKATGEYLCFIDSDDYIASNFLEIILDKISCNTCMVALGLTKFKNDNINNQKIVSHRLKKGNYDLTMLIPILIDDGTLSGFTFHSSCSVLFRKSLIVKSGLRFNENLKYNEDGLFVSEYLLNCEKGCIYVDFETAPYYYRENNVSATHSINIDRYESDMNCIELILNKYSDKNNVKEQIIKRRATVTFDVLLLLSAPTIKDIKSLLIRNKGIESFKAIKIHNLKRSKKIVYILIRLHLFGLIKCIISFRNKGMV